MILSAVNNLRKPDDILLIIGTVGENKKSTDHSIYSKEYSKQSTIVAIELLTYEITSGNEYRQRLTERSDVIMSKNKSIFDIIY